MTPSRVESPPATLFARREHELLTGACDPVHVPNIRLPISPERDLFIFGRRPFYHPLGGGKCLHSPASPFKSR